MGSISGDVLSGLRRRQLYSTIYALKREVNCLSTDLMRYQLISRKCENYLTDLRNVGHVCSGFDHRLRLESLTLEINALKDTKSCFILMQNNLQVFNDFLANRKTFLAIIQFKDTFNLKTFCCLKNKIPIARVSQSVTNPCVS